MGEVPRDGQRSEDTRSPAGEEGAEMILGGATRRKWEDGSLRREAWGESGADKLPTSTFMVLWTQRPLQH